MSAVAAEGGFVPPALLSRPTLYEGLKWVWDGFIALNNSRQMKQEQATKGEKVVTVSKPCPLTLQEIAAYMDIVGYYDVEQKQEFLCLVQELDKEYINWRNERLA